MGEHAVSVAMAVEAMSLLGEGVAAGEIEEREPLAVEGPLALADILSLTFIDRLFHDEHAHKEGHSHSSPANNLHSDSHAAQTVHSHLEGGKPKDQLRTSRPKAHREHDPKSSSWIPPSAVYVLEKMAHGYKRLGREHGAGFYDYPANEPKRLWSGLKVFERGGKAIPGEDVRDRLLYAAAIEGLRRLDDPATLRAEAVALAEVLGPGFPACDPVAFVQSVGLREFAERAQQLAARYGDRFVVPTGALERVAGGRSS